VLLTLLLLDLFLLKKFGLVILSCPFFLLLRQKENWIKNSLLIQIYLFALDLSNSSSEIGFHGVLFWVGYSVVWIFSSYFETSWRSFAVLSISLFMMLIFLSHPLSYVKISISWLLFFFLSQFFSEP